MLSFFSVSATKIKEYITGMEGDLSLSAMGYKRNAVGLKEVKPPVPLKVL